MKITLEFSIKDILDIYDPFKDGYVNRDKIRKILKENKKKTLKAIAADFTEILKMAGEDSDTFDAVEGVFGPDCLNDED